MSFLRDLIIESAAAGATGAGSVANARGTLFGGGVVNQAAEDKRKTKMLRRIGYFKVGDAHTLTGGSKWKQIAEKAFDDSFDTSDEISKLDDAEKKADAGNDTTCFGMEDETGALVKVYVRDEQAEDFEHALATMLAGADEDADDDNSHGEIAEVLYQLKDKFDIVDVDWGVIEGDEEEEQEVEGDLEGGDPDTEGDPGDGEGGDLEDGEGLDEVGSGEEDAKSALQDVIGMMRADAEAKKAEADARKAAAEAETARYAITAAEQKVAQEEQILDMETHEKGQKDAEKEAKTLAKLAKYRHEIRGNGNVKAAPATSDVGEDSLDLEENEEQEGSTTGSEVSKEDLADMIFRHLQAQS
jgi:hypothetical protein